MAHEQETIDTPFPHTQKCVLYAPSCRLCVPGARGSSAVSLRRLRAAGTHPSARACASSHPRWSAARARPDTVHTSASAAEPAALADSPDEPAVALKSGQPVVDSADGRASPAPPLSKNTENNCDPGPWTTKPFIRVNWFFLLRFKVELGKCPP